MEKTGLDFITKWQVVVGRMQLVYYFMPFMSITEEKLEITRHHLIDVDELLRWVVAIH